MALNVVVTAAGGARWTLTDRLARKVGSIIQSEDAVFLIEPEGDTIASVKRNPFTSLSLAMSEIERVTKGACQLTEDR